MTMRIADTAHVVDKRDHSEVSCFFGKQTVVVNYTADTSLSTRCTTRQQWEESTT